MPSKYPDRKTKNRVISRTKKGVLSGLVARHRTKARQRNWPMPDYDVKYLQDRFLEDVYFNALYDAWVHGGYQRWDKPSIDRIDPDKPYTKNNIQMMSYKENARKADTSERARTEVIMCDMDGTELQRFPSMTAASIATGASIGNISSCCKDQRLSAKGYRWKFGDRRKHRSLDIYTVIPFSEEPEVTTRRAVLEYWKKNPRLTAAQVASTFKIDSAKRVRQWRDRALHERRQEIARRQAIKQAQAQVGGP